MATPAPSRWDGYSGNYAPGGVAPGGVMSSSSNVGQTSVMQQQYDQIVRSGALTNVNGQQEILRTGLVDKRINTIDPTFYDCVYGIQNSATTVIERCYKDLGCCNNGCCPNDDWHRKYGWAVALIVIFCIFVVIAVAVWLVVWLINRSKDKRQKREILEESYSQMPTPQPTPIQEQYSFEPAQLNGYRY